MCIFYFSTPLQIVDDASASSIGTPTTISALPSPHAKVEEDEDDSSDEFGNAKKPVHK